MSDVREVNLCKRCNYLNNLELINCENCDNLLETNHLLLSKDLDFMPLNSSNKTTIKEMLHDIEEVSLINNQTYLLSNEEFKIELEFKVVEQVIGRLDFNNYPNSSLISRNHLYYYLSSDNSLVVVDKQSANGTLLNYEEMIKNVPYRISENDLITFYDLTLKFNLKK